MHATRRGTSAGECQIATKLFFPRLRWHWQSSFPLRRGGRSLSRYDDWIASFLLFLIAAVKFLRIPFISLFPTKPTSVTGLSTAFFMSSGKEETTEEKRGGAGEGKMHGHFVKGRESEPPCHDCRCEWEAERGAFQFIAQLPSPNLTSSPPPSSAPLNSPDRPFRLAVQWQRRISFSLLSRAAGEYFSEMRSSPEWSGSKGLIVFHENLK